MEWKKIGGSYKYFPGADGGFQLRQLANTCVIEVTSVSEDLLKSIILSVYERMIPETTG